MTRFRAAAATVLLALGLAGCDSTPNASFRQQQQDRAAAQAGDPYASLEGSLPRQPTFLATSMAKRQGWAAREATTYRGVYDSLRRGLESDKAVAAMMAEGKPTVDACRAAYAAASKFVKEDAATARGPGGAAAALNACRDEAQRRIANGRDTDAATTLSRFASAAIVMIGVTTVGRGDASAGMRLWNEGNALVAKDKPGFRISIRSFWPA